MNEYEKQANDQGFTLGDSADFVQRVGFGFTAAYMHGCITDSEYKRIMKRFQKKIIMKNLREL